MIALVSLFIFITLSLLINHVATVALTLTGLSQESVRSAFTGVGFATTEAEKVVNHPVRRRIIMLLMLSGNAGIVTVVSSLVLTFVAASTSQALFLRLSLLLVGLVVLWFVATSQRVDYHLSQLIRWALRRWTSLDVGDYANLLHLAGGYRVIELQVEP